jgi:diguanylate cyclase (GGDEF)-like protein
MDGTEGNGAAKMNTLVKSDQWRQDHINMMIENRGILLFEYDAEHDSFVITGNANESDKKETVINSAREELIHYIHPDNQEAINQAVKQALYASISGQLEFQAKLGADWRWLQVQYNSIVDQQNRNSRIFGIAMDIQKCKEKEELDQKRSASFTSFLNSEADLSLCFDSKTGKRTILPGDVIPKSMSPGITLGQLSEILREKVNIEDVERIRKKVGDQQFEEDGRIITCECRFESYTGSYRGYHWFELSSQIVKHANADSGDADVFIQLKDIDEKKLEELRLSEMAKRDQLTGLLTLDSFREGCKQWCNDQNRKGGCALAVMELDSFIEYNQRFGYMAGDSVLQQTALTLQALIQKDDKCARVSGALFVILLKDHEDLQYLQEKLRILQIALTRRYQEDQELTASIGVAVVNQEDNQHDFDTAFEHARSALVEARSLGGNRVQFFNASNIVDRPETSKLQEKPEIPIPVSSLDSNAEVCSKHHVEIRTFGFFEIFVDGNPVSFRNPKAKELLALMVDRNGGYIRSDEAISYLWEDEMIDKVSRAKYRKTAMYLKKTLEDNDIDYIIEIGSRKRRIIPERVDCDYFHYLEEGKRAHKQFRGSYMLNYSWAETTAAELSMIMNEIMEKSVSELERSNQINTRPYVKSSIF